MRLGLTLLLLAILAGMTTWFLRQINPSSAQPKTATHTPDYYLEKATVTQLNQQGELETRLLSTLITHHPDDDSIDLKQPRFTWLGNPPGKQPPWHVTAMHGTIPANRNIVHLRGNVVVTHPTESGGKLKILTPKLNLYTNTRQARTDAPVEIIHGPSHVHAIGMILNLPKNHLQLNSAVRGVYVH